MAAAWKSLQERNVATDETEEGYAAKLGDSVSSPYRAFTFFYFVSRLVPSCVLLDLLYECLDPRQTSTYMGDYTREIVSISILKRLPLWMWHVCPNSFGCLFFREGVLALTAVLAHFFG